MKIKELLNSHYEISCAIDSKLEVIAELKSLATKVTTSPFTGSRSEGTYSDRVGRTTARIVDLEAEINAEIDKLVEVKEEIRCIIATVPDSRRRTVLERKYILNQNWEIIAEKMGYSPRQIMRIHNAAIEELEAYYDGSCA